MELSPVLVFTLLILGTQNVSYGQNILGSLFGIGNENRASGVEDTFAGSIVKSKADESVNLLGASLKALTGGLEKPGVVDTQLIRNLNNGNHAEYHRSPLNWLNMNNGINPSVKEKLNRGNYQDEDVKLAAQQFPQLQALLDKLKELNRQKELQQHGHNTPGTTTDRFTTELHNVGHENTQGSKDKHQEQKMKSLRKKKFYFQAKVVRPENEKDDEDEVVYYED